MMRDSLNSAPIAEDMADAVQRPYTQVALVFRESGEIEVTSNVNGADNLLPPIYPERMGDRRFTSLHGVRFPYCVGAMARGIATADMVIEAQRAGFLGFFGAAGLGLDEIEAAINRVETSLGPNAPGWGSNLIHSPQAPETERATVDLYLRKGVRRMSASAYMTLSPDVVRFAAKGLRLNAQGIVERQNHVFAKVSHPTVAAAFMAPAPADMVAALRDRGDLTDTEADLITRCPVACDVTAEADSGGHTDNRAAAVLFTALSETRAKVCAEHGLDPDTIRIGLAGGIGSPAAVAGAFAMGAAYVVTGSINQATVESGLSPNAKAMLADVGLDDVAMAPAADMFERGVKVQVLRRASFFAIRAERLYELYRTHERLEDLSDKDLAFVETCLGEPLEDAWEKTLSYLMDSRPKDAQRATASGKAKMGFLFRRYLFQCAQWARAGDQDHKAEYQIWCGPALGAFNDWARGSAFEDLSERSVRRVGYALLRGAAQIVRAQQLRVAGVAVPPALFRAPPAVASAYESVA